MENWLIDWLIGMSTCLGLFSNERIPVDLNFYPWLDCKIRLKKNQCSKLKSQLENLTSTCVVLIGSQWYQIGLKGRTELLYSSNQIVKYYLVVCVGGRGYKMHWKSGLTGQSSTFLFKMNKFWDNFINKTNLEIKNIQKMQLSSLSPHLPISHLASSFSASPFLIYLLPLCLLFSLAPSLPIHSLLLLLLSP